MHTGIFRTGSSIAGLLALLWMVAGSSAPAPRPDAAAGFGPDEHYYSLMEFARDQHKLWYGQPLSLLRVVTRGQERDSDYVALSRVKWSEIFRYAAEADISARKYLGRYQFSYVFDSTTYIRSFVYQAAEPELPTRMMLITVNPVNERITSVYVQYEKSGLSRKMYYEPRSYLRIEEEGQGAARNLRTDYYWQ